MALSVAASGAQASAPADTSPKRVVPTVSRRGLPGLRGFDRRKCTWLLIFLSGQWLIEKYGRHCGSAGENALLGSLIAQHSRGLSSLTAAHGNRRSSCGGGVG